VCDPDVAHVVQDAAGNRVTVCWSDGSVRRVALPVLPRSNLAQRCLSVLLEELPAQAFHDLYGSFVAQTGGSFGPPACAPTP